MPVRPRWWCEHAVLPGGRVAGGVVLDVDGDRFSQVTRSPSAPADAVALRGVTLPGLANCHSHAFHRALRARAQRDRGTFWTWREQMYSVAARLTPDNYLRLARATFAEMALAGITGVAEFHYVHHGADGTPYDDPNATGVAVAEAARQAGIRLTMLDTCYLHGGIGQPLEGPQVRFGDRDAGAWVQRVDALTSDDRIRVGAAIHSCRAVEPDEMAVVAEWARRRQAPLHVHVSEQPAENEACIQAWGRTPVELLDDAGALGHHVCAVHATHLTESDVLRLGETRTAVCMCPTTERDLADGIGPARAVFHAGAPVCVGSDSNAVIDLFDEARAVELDERLATQVRGHWSAGELFAVLTTAGHRAIGWPDAGRLEAGALADFVTVRLDSVRTAGSGSDPLDSVLFAATAADIDTVVVGGSVIVSDGRHLLVDDVPGELTSATALVT